MNAPASPAANPLDLSDTIAAQATPAGRGALSVIRLSGPCAHAIVRDAVDRWPDQPRSAVLTTVRDGDGAEVDQAVVIRYDAPASYTGEDAVELMTHGGLLVPATVLAALISRGARMAEPGEFTRRAVLNGKLDILQAEATGDLVNANSRAAQAAALRQLDGGLSRRVLSLRDQLIGLEALIAYDIDFPEEDEGPISPARLQAEINTVILALEQLLATARRGELVREGALVVLAGSPNVGKSSLFNAFLGQRRAIVTEIPGTTRDAIEAVIDAPAFPLRLVDTAGLRAAVDPVEKIGVAVSESYVARAAVVLACGDTPESMSAVAEALRDHTTAPVIAVRTKADVQRPSSEELATDRATLAAVDAVSVSAETGEGLAALLRTVSTAIDDAQVPSTSDAPLLTHERHRYAVARALDETRAFRDRWQGDDVPATVAAVHLREAVTTLEDLIGRVDVEHVLDELFRRFCVGK